jgi:glycosyltransferase involved in cell wall biosynthesis
MTDPALRLALDVGPLYGHRTGVGTAVDGLFDALLRHPAVDVVGYLVSGRAHVVEAHRRLPLPGIIASHLWSRADHPRVDRWLGDAEVIHGTNYVAPPSALPTIISVYDCWFLRHPERANPLVRRAGQTLRRAVAGGAWVHVSSEATAAQARELLATDRVVTIHLGPPPPPPPLSALTRPVVAERISGRQFIVAIGTEERRKDLDLLIRAFSIVAAEAPDVWLVLAGASGDDSAAVDAAIGTLPLSARSRVERLGPVDDDTKHWLLRQASVLAYPSLDEGFGFPILEAQLAGTPVVARNVGAIGEIAGTGALLVDDRDPEQFALGLQRVLQPGSTRLTLIESGNRNVKRFDWDATASDLIELYGRARRAAQ